MIDSADQQQTEERSQLFQSKTVRFSDVCECYYAWRTKACGGLYIDPTKPDDRATHRITLRAKKERANVFRILQVI